MLPCLRILRKPNSPHSSPQEFFTFIVLIVCNRLCLNVKYIVIYKKKKPTPPKSSSPCIQCSGMEQMTISLRASQREKLISKRDLTFCFVALPRSQNYFAHIILMTDLSKKTRSKNRMKSLDVWIDADFLLSRKAIHWHCQRQSRQLPRRGLQLGFLYLQLGAKSQIVPLLLGLPPIKKNLELPQVFPRLPLVSALSGPSLQFCKDLFLAL